MSTISRRLGKLELTRIPPSLPRVVLVRPGDSEPEERPGVQTIAVRFVRADFLGR